MSKIHWVALTSIPGVGGKTVTRLLQHFGSTSAILAASPAELDAVPRLSDTQAQAIARLSLPRVEERIARYEAQGIQVITWEEPAYPGNLLLAADGPPVLYLRGALHPTDNQSVSIVGTRQPHPDKAALAQYLASELARRGWTIVSGLALGIDAAAHQGALSAGGWTLAVLGSGVNNVYPQRHTRLADQIMEQGAVLAEVLPETGITRQNLIARNRLTSGLSKAVIVIQSSADSGTANTARRAREQGRTVFVITGDGDEHLLTEGDIPLAPDSINVDELSARLDALEIRRPPDDAPIQPRLV